MTPEERHHLAEDLNTTAEQLWSLLGGRAAALTEQPEANEDMTRQVDLVLVDGGSSKIAIIKQLRVLTGLGLKETKDYVDQIPSVIVKNGTLGDMLSWAKQIEEVGAKARLRGLLQRQDVGLCRRLARHPNAPKDLLEYLWHSDDHEVQEGIAQNPNTPNELLFLVAKEHPTAFFQNPLLPLWQLEDPLLRQIPRKILVKIPLSQEALNRFWPALMDSRQHRLLLAESSLSLSNEVLEALALDSDDEVRIKVAQHPQCSASLLERLSQDPSAKVRAGTISNTNLPRSIRESFYNDTNIRIQTALAGYPDTPKELLYQLAEQDCKEDDEDVLDALSMNPNTPLDLLERLIEDGERHAALAKNPRTPAPLLMRIVENYDLWALEILAQRPSLPPEIITRLLTHFYSSVRIIAKQNAQAPQTLLALLWRAGATENLDGFAPERQESNVSEKELLFLVGLGSFARQLAARHPNTPIEKLRELLVDEQEEVRKQALQNPRAPSELVDLLLRAESREEKEHPTLSTKELALLSALGFWGQLLAAKHPNTDEETFEKLVASSDYNLLDTLLKNPKAPPKILSRIFAMEPRYLSFQRDLAKHPNTPADILLELYKASGREDSEEKAMPLSSALAQNPSAPASLLWKIAQERPWLREEISKNTGAPKDLLQWLKEGQA